VEKSHPTQTNYGQSPRTIARQTPQAPQHLDEAVLGRAFHGGRSALLGGFGLDVWLGLRVSRIDISGELEKHLVKTNLVSSPPPNKKTWHAVHSGRGIFGLKTRDPMILVRYLDARNASHDLAWLSWTKANPKAAAVVWKGVTDLAIAGKYTSIPDLLEAAEGITDKDVAQTKTAVAKIVEKVAKPQPDTRPADAGVEKPDAEEAADESEPATKNSGKN
jgi:hypothetical protein